MAYFSCHFSESPNLKNCPLQKLLYIWTLFGLYRHFNFQNTYNQHLKPYHAQTKRCNYCL